MNGPSTLKTTIKKKTLDPVWNELLKVCIMRCIALTELTLFPQHGPRMHRGVELNCRTGKRTLEEEKKGRILFF